MLIVELNLHAVRPVDIIDTKRFKILVKIPFETFVRYISVRTMGAAEYLNRNSNKYRIQ